MSLLNPEVVNGMPFYITPQLQLSERYIENHYGNSNQQTEDYITSALASLHLEYQFPHGQLGTNLSVESSYSRETLWVNRLNQYGDLNYVYQVPRGSIGLKGSLVSTQFGETVPQNNEGFLTHSTEYLQETAGVQGNYLITKLLSMAMSYTYTNNEYSSAAYVNSETHSATGSISYPDKKMGKWSLLGGANVYRYIPGSTIKTFSANVQWTRQIAETTTLLIATGAGETSGRRVFWLANLNLTKNFELGSAQAGYSRNFGTGGGLVDTAVITQQGTLSFSRKLTEALGGTLSGSVGDSSSVSTGSDYQTKFWNASAGLNYRILSWLSGALTYSYFYQNIQGTLSETLGSNQVFLSLSTIFPQWRPFNE